MFPSPYLNQILDEAHRADLLKQMTGRPRAGRTVVRSSAAALARLLKREVS
ncbi:MAG: hypothetical protein ACYCXW_14455 [Solirubrobacteraceae bacterium]